MFDRNKIRKIVLVNPPMNIEEVYGKFSELGGASPPTGLCYLAGYLRDFGYDVSIIDGEALRLSCHDTVSKILTEQPDFVGLSCKTLWVTNAGKIAKLIKEKNRDIIVSAGGHHVTSLPKQSLQEFSGFDSIIIGEGEITLLEYINTINENSDYSSVQSLAYRDGADIKVNSRREETIDINKLHKPAFDLLPDLATHYNPSIINVKSLPAFPLITSRGCPFQCAFCDRNVFGNTTRIPSAEYTFSIVEELYYKYGIHNLLFDDDNIMINKTIFLKLMNFIKESDMKLSFSCQARVNSIDEDSLKILKESGCWQLMFGIESGSQKMLKAMKKGTKLHQIENAVSMCRKIGIKTLGMFIFGYPGETIETLQETEMFIRKLKLDDLASFFFTPLPGSDVYDDIEKYGKYEKQWNKGNSLDHALFIPDGLDEKTLKKFVNLCNNACYSNLRQLIRIPTRFTSLTHTKAFLQSIPKLMFSSHN
ncbi:Fe-S oxidoreductase [Candidatus Scalindua japonica]|uniref:Fe-S oxidoreductase n=1 Tax=Candidatus Scalindua japonica TaxID=1284222 RepID=A0A286U2D0_9BACT|nr:radical SAM protein [Candidatus Scalindua japonica]GAX62294.1 Fe-S oxidoreductase [Candidatus Scalindua japonica]